MRFFSINIRQFGFRAKYVSRERRRDSIHAILLEPDPVLVLIS